MALWCPGADLGPSAPRLRRTTRKQGRCTSSATRGTVADHARSPSSGRTAASWSRIVEQPAHVDLPLPCTFDFDVAAQNTRPFSSTGTSCCSFLFSGTVFTRGALGGLRRRAHSWDWEPRYALPVGGLAVADGRILPERGGWNRLHGPTSSRPGEGKVWVDGLDSLGGPPSKGCWPGPVTGAVNTGLSLARAVADAVLYAVTPGPLPRLAAKNQARWQFGVLGPLGAAASGARETADMAADRLLQPGPVAWVDVHLRFLHLQSRSAERADAGGFMPVDGLTVGASRWLAGTRQRIRRSPSGRTASASLPRAYARR